MYDLGFNFMDNSDFDKYLDRNPDLTKPLALLSANDIDNFSLQASTNTQTSRALETTLHYLRGFVTNPHRHLGRSGNVCPMTNKAMEKDLIFLSPYIGEISLGRIMDTVTRLRDVFLNIPTESESEKVYRAVLLVFSDLAENDFPLIDVAQSRLKDEFVQEGLMVGQFHHKCQEGGIRNPEFRPLRSPYPFIAIRHMTASDLIFLSSSPNHFKAYQKYITVDSVPKHLSELYEETCLKFNK